MAAWRRQGISPASFHTGYSFCRTGFSAEKYNRGRGAGIFINRIYRMDCMELMGRMPDNSVSMILTDPPYGIAYQNHFTRKKQPV